MNRRIIPTVAIAFALLGGGAAIAAEATQFDIATGAVSRAEIKAELSRALRAGELNVVSADYGTVAAAGTSARSRAEVRAEARIEARSSRFDSLYVGS